jgi:DNA-binding FadR family transcriptional regulator
MGLAAIARDAGRMHEIIGEHRELADAVIERKPTNALGIIDRHLHGTQRLLLPQPPVPGPSS